jgi:hypothetical protein
MATKTTHVCDCGFRESDNNLGWARVTVNGASDGMQLMPDVSTKIFVKYAGARLTLMKQVHEATGAVRKDN